MLSKTQKPFGKGMSCAAEETVQKNKTGKKQQRYETQKKKSEKQFEKRGGRK